MMEVTNRLKGLDLIDRVPEELWTEIRDILQEAVIKTIPKKKTKWLSEEALQIAEKREKLKSKAKRKDIPFECRVPKNTKEKKESLPQRSVQTNRGKK